MNRPSTQRPDRTELDALLAALFEAYHYDFRDYARSHIERRIERAQTVLGAPTLAELRGLVLADPDAFTALLREMTITVSELFRDPATFAAIRRDVVPYLATYPSPRIWVAGCGAGEEAYSFAILLEEEGLLDRSFIYATDIDAESLRAARAGAYALDRMRGFSENYFLAGGRSSLSDYYTASYGRAVFGQTLKKHILFSDHSVATDAAFAEVALVSSEEVRSSSRPSSRRNSSIPPGREQERPTVLVVDDVADNRLAMQAALLGEDFEVVTAGSGREALETLLRREVAVAIIDVMMPEMDGFELAELIRGVERTRRIPIIFVTAATGTKERVSAGYESGAIDFLLKPVDVNILRAKVLVLVSLERQRCLTQRALEEAQRARTEAERLLRLAESMGSADEVDGILGLCLDAARDLLGAPRSACFLSDEAGSETLRASRGLSEAFGAALRRHGAWPSGERARQPVFALGERADSLVAAAFPSDEPFGEYACIPLAVGDRLLGRILLFWKECRSFSPHDEELAAAIASQTAGALERARLRDAERRTHQETEQTLRYNETFAGILAHDLRNPLWAIHCNAQLLLQQFPKVNELQPPVRRTLASCERMLQMIEQLLDLTSLRVGKGFTLDRQDVDLGEVCSQAVSELRAAHSLWTIRVDVKGDVRGTWDSGRLLQVASNLVSNAGEHGAGPEIAVVVDGLDSERVELSVHNAGEVPSELLPDLFSPFRRPRAKNSGGLGLGLFITREIVRAHGGSIEVASTASSGTTFVVHLSRQATTSSLP